MISLYLHSYCSQKINTRANMSFYFHWGKWVWFEKMICGCLRKSVSYSTNVDVIWDNFLMDNLSLHIKSHKIFIFFDLEVLTLRNKHRSEVSLLLITFLSPLAYKRTQSDYKSYSAFFNKKARKHYIQSLGKQCHGNISYVLSEKDDTVCVQYYN